MAALAAEFGLSETAFLHRGDGGWGLRWFSPAMEIPLCGHGTLAAARALLEAGLPPGDGVFRFATMAGELRARPEGSLVELDFPARPVREAPLPEALGRALGLRAAPAYVGVNAGRNWLLELESAEAVSDLAPDREATMALASVLHGIIVTARGDPRPPGRRASPGGEEAAVCSRFFAPESGVFEDPVTGSAHCALAPYWAPRLGREDFLAWQASPRGGSVRVGFRGERVLLAGSSVVVAEGRISEGALA